MSLVEALRPLNTQDGHLQLTPDRNAALHGPPLSRSRKPAVDLGILQRPETVHIEEGLPPAAPWITSSMGARAPRMLDRNSSFKQSGGRLNIRRKSDRARSVQSLKDGFHTLVNMSTGKSFALAIVCIVGSWLLFAVFFRMISASCGLGANTFLKALYLSIETMETIGYGVPSSYFDECRAGLFVLGACTIWGSLLNALIIAVVYTRISRPQSRASSICFSEKAIIAQIRGEIYVMFQVCDLRKHQLIEAHVRLYCVQHAPSSTGICFQTRAMRLQHPDDELGGMLLLALPQLVVHRVDPWSPFWPDDPDAAFALDQNPATSYRFPEIHQRAADGENGNRDVGPIQQRPSPPTLLEVTERVRSGQLEVLCLVEGIDPSTSMTLQARHSYTSDDLVFNAAFQRCVTRAADGKCEIDFEAFHQIVEQDYGSDLLVQSMA